MKREARIGAGLGIVLVLLIGISLVEIGEPKSITIDYSAAAANSNGLVPTRAMELKSEMVSYHQELDKLPQAEKVETFEEMQTFADLDGINASASGPIALLWVAGSLIVVVGLLVRFS